jgi:hypothetical protein
VKPAEVIAEAKRQVTELTGLTAETVSAVDRNGKSWTVTVEALELERVPNTMDVLGSYEIVLTEGGDLKGLTRRRRYHRADVRDEEG